MENTSHALIMSASVLLLIIALTVAISSFSKIKSQTQEILLDRNKVQMAKDDTGSYLNYLQSTGKNTSRIVGIETIISSIRRMEKERYYIYIATNKSIEFLSKNQPESEISKGKLPYDMKSNVLVDGKNTIFMSKDNTGYKNITDTRVTAILYNKLKNSKFTENYGTYKFNQEGVLEDDKLLYKVITFVEE